MPKVSIIIPVYNGEKYIKKTLSSVFNQSFKGFEVITIDDGSQDKTKEILKTYGKKIRYIHQKNKGTAAARNTGIKAAKGKYIAFLDQDDLWLPQKLAEQVKILDKKPKVGLVFCGSFLLNEGRLIGFFHSILGINSAISAKDIFNQLVKENFIPTLTVLLRKEAFDKLGFLKEDFVGTDDHEMWLRVAEYGYRFEAVRKNLAIYRIHPEAQSRKFKNMYQNTAKIYDQLLKRPDFSRTEKRKIRQAKKRIYLNYKKGYHWAKSNELLRKGKYSAARQLFLKGFKYNRKSPKAIFNFVLYFLSPWLLGKIYSCFTAIKGVFCGFLLSLQGVSLKDYA